MSFLTIEAVSKSFGATVALADVRLAVAAGGRTAVVGPSGSGKSTLMRLIAGFDTPDRGRIMLGGRLLADGPAATPAHLRDVGVVMQDGALFPHLSVADNIGFGLPRRAPGRAAAVAELMEMVGLDAAMLRRRPDMLSGGQQQRVALARALARRPKLMLLDEPFSALDPALRAGTRKAVADLLRSVGVTTILVTHDQAEALSFADQVAVMGAGKLLQAGPPQELYLRPRTPMIAELLGDALILPATLAEGWARCALGRLATDDPHRRGAADVMLRPEQIVLTPSDAGTADGDVAGVDFAGAAYTVALRLRREPGLTLSLRQTGHELPVPGTPVRIAVAGAAHVFDTSP